MKTSKDARTELQELFGIALAKGLAHNRKGFAELVGVHPANLSSFLSGYTPITDQTMSKIRNAAIAAGVIESINAPVLNAESVNAPFCKFARMYLPAIGRTEPQAVAKQKRPQRGHYQRAAHAL